MNIAHLADLLGYVTVALFWLLFVAWAVLKYPRY
jgi:hypothetical protein